MEYHSENGNIIYFLKGSLRADNAENVKSEIMSVIASHPDEEIIFDASDLHFISSSGLRVLLAVQKMKEPEKVVVRNVGKGIFSVLDMTGFTSILDVQVKMREISLEGSAVIGRGQSSTVYRFGKENIVKLYNTRVPLEKIQQEIDFSKKAFVAGIPTAISYDLVTCNGHYGAVFEMVDHADTVGHTLTAHPEEFATRVPTSLQVLFSQNPTKCLTSRSFFPMMQAFYETGLYEEKTNDGIDNGAIDSGCRQCSGRAEIGGETYGANPL